MKTKSIFIAAFLLFLASFCFADFGQPVGNVNQNLNPQATVTPSPNNIPKAYSNGTIDFGWLEGGGTFQLNYEIANCASACGHGGTGTTLNKIAVLTAANPSTVTLAATTDTTGAVGVVIGGAGTTSNAIISGGSQVSCVFDGATTAGDYVVISTNTAGDCMDAGATIPTSGQVLGRVLSTNAGTGTYAMTLASPYYGIPTRASLSAASSGSNSDITSLSGLTTPLSVGQGGTGTNSGSITGTGPLAFAAGGSSQNVTLTPSGSGYTILNGNVGIGTTTPDNTIQVAKLINFDNTLVNTWLGYQAGNSNTTGGSNTANGFESLFYNTTGGANTAIGVQALYSNTTGNNNTASGDDSLYSNTTGGANTASGVQALFYNTTGINNTAIGGYSLFSNTTGGGNTAIGDDSLYSNTTGVNNTANGYDSLYYNTTGGGNTANGFESLFYNTTGGGNTASGVQALFYNTTGGGNTAIGGDSLFSNTTGGGNTAIGGGSLYSNTTGTYNTAIGDDSLYFNTTGTYNTALGYQAGSYIANGSTANLTATNSLYLGYNAYPLADNDTNETVIGPNAVGNGSNSTTLGNASVTKTIIPAGNVGIGTTTPDNTIQVAKLINFDNTLVNTWLGYQAGNSNTTGGTNTAIGYDSLYSNTTGGNNTANGFCSLYYNITGTYNTAIGDDSLFYNITGTYNTANGDYSLYSNTTGGNNTANGYASLFSNTTGGSNTALGYQAGSYIANGSTANLTATNSLYLGYNAYPLADNDTNETVIGPNAVGNGSNSTTLGNASVTKTIIPAGSVGIGTTSPSQILHVLGNIEHSTAAANSGGGLIQKVVEAVSPALSGPTGTITLGIPAGDRIKAIQLRVDTLITISGGTTWSAVYTNTPSTAICTGRLLTKNTVFNAIHPAYEITTGTVAITIAANTGNFTAGVVRAIVYYDELDPMSAAQ